MSENTGDIPVNIYSLRNNQNTVHQIISSSSEMLLNVHKYHIKDCYGQEATSTFIQLPSSKITTYRPTVIAIKTNFLSVFFDRHFMLEKGGNEVE